MDKQKFRVVHEDYADISDNAIEEHEKALKAEIQKHISVAQKELDEGTLHGIVIVRVNNDHEVAGGVAICSDAARDVGHKLQEISMDLSLPPELARLLKGLFTRMREREDRESSEDHNHH